MQPRANSSDEALGQPEFRQFVRVTLDVLAWCLARLVVRKNL
jgi:hypothetical protein